MYVYIYIYVCIRCARVNYDMNYVYRVYMNAV